MTFSTLLAPLRDFRPYPETHAPAHTQMPLPTTPWRFLNSRTCCAAAEETKSSGGSGGMAASIRPCRSFTAHYLPCSSSSPSPSRSSQPLVPNYSFCLPADVFSQLFCLCAIPPIFRFSSRYFCLSSVSVSDPCMPALLFLSWSPFIKLSLHLFLCASAYLFLLLLPPI